MLMMFVNILLFALELIICAALIFYILKADRWVLNMKQVIKTGSYEAVSAIKEFKASLKKANTALKHIKNFKQSLTRKLIAQALDLVSILQLFTAEKQTKKLWKTVGLKIVKGFLLGFKMVNE